MILAVDLGSTSFKAAIYDHDLQELGAGGHPVEHTFSSGGHIELPVQNAEQAFAGAIDAALQAAGIDAGHLTALTIDSQAQTFTVLDPAGRPKHPFISWQDARASAAAKRLAADESLADFPRHCSFSRFLPSLHLCQVCELQSQPSPMIGNGDLILHLPTYLIHLCSDTAVIDDNLAAMSGFYSIGQGDWWQPGLQAAGVERANLPGLVRVGQVGTHTSDSAARFGLPAGLPIVLAGNDQTAGGYAVQVAEHDAVLITLGTALCAYTAQETLLDHAVGLVRGPYPGGLFYGLVTDSCGGNIINWAKTVIAGGDSDSAFFALAEQAEPGCQGLVFDSSLPTGQGSWQKLGLNHGPADLARAVVESLVERMAARMETLQLPPDTHYLVAGGGSKAKFWVDSLAQRLGTELTVTTANPLLGAARMASDALS